MVSSCRHVQFGVKLRSRGLHHESVHTPISDIRPKSGHGSDVPCVDGSELARKNFTLLCWSVRPCVRLVCAVHMTAGHNALRGSGSGQ